MPDISMCKTVECPRRKACYRYVAAPALRQSYTRFDPHSETNPCKHHMVVCRETRKHWEHGVRLYLNGLLEVEQ